MKRPIFIGVCFTFFYIILIAHLYHLQSENIIYAKNENNVYLGRIYFTDKTDNLLPVAVNKEFKIVYANPQKIKNEKETAKKVCSILNLNEDELYKKFLNKKSLYLLLSQRPTQEEIKKISTIQDKGLGIKNELFRYYPYKNLASQTIGFVGYTKENDYPIGLYGLEKFYRDKLKKEDLLSTIDINVQSKIEQILEENIKKFDAVGGTIIVQNPKTGEILALANKPDFNPNQYSKQDISLFSNPAVESRYEPGSVIKPFTVAIGLQSKKFVPDFSFVDKGKITLNGKKITNWDNKAYGKIKVVDVLKHSINTGAVFLQRKIGHKIFASYMKDFFSRTGIDLPNEVNPDFSSLKNGKDIDYACASFGQGIAVSPIQLVNSFSALVNGGKLMRPYLNRELNPKIIKQIISPEVSRIVRNMLEQTVEEAGVAAIKGFAIGGKTGTALVPDIENKRYSNDVIDSFVGFINDPSEITVLIKLDKPKGAPLSGRTVVPAFKKIAQFIISYYHLKPDNT